MSQFRTRALCRNGKTYRQFFTIYSVSKKIPPEDLWQFFQNGWKFFNQILHAYYVFLSTLDYEFLFDYLQL